MTTRIRPASPLISAGYGQATLSPCKLAVSRGAWKTKYSFCIIWNPHGALYPPPSTVPPGLTAVINKLHAGYAAFTNWCSSGGSSQPWDELQRLAPGVQPSGMYCCQLFSLFFCRGEEIWQVHLVLITKPLWELEWEQCQLLCCVSLCSLSAYEPIQILSPVHRPTVAHSTLQKPPCVHMVKYGQVSAEYWLGWGAWLTDWGILNVLAKPPRKSACVLKQQRDKHSPGSLQQTLSSAGQICR